MLQCFDSVHLIVIAVAGKVVLLTQRSGLCFKYYFNYIENLKIASSKRHISVSLSMEDYCPVWALSWHTLQCVRHHVTPQCVRPCLPSLLGHVECTPTPPSPWTRQLGERVNKHNKPLLWIFSLGPSLPLRPQPPCPGPDSQTSKSCSHKKFTDGSA